MKQTFQISASADPCTKGVSMFISMRNNDEAVLFLDSEVIITFLPVTSNTAYSLFFKPRVSYNLNI